MDPAAYTFAGTGCSAADEDSHHQSSGGKKKQKQKKQRQQKQQNQLVGPGLFRDRMGLAAVQGRVPGHLDADAGHTTWLRYSAHYSLIIK